MRVNKQLIICLFFLLAGSLARSQTSTFSPEWAYGVNLGNTYSKVSFTSSIRVPQELLSQYSGGLSVRYISEEHFGIYGELNFSQRGWKERSDSVHLNHLTRSLSYIELPLMSHIYFSMGSRARFFANVGPQIGYNIGDKIQEKIVFDPENATYYNLKVQQKFDYGLKGAIGLEFRTGIGSFILDGRYYFGLSDIYHNTRADIFQSSSNQVIGVNLSYLLRK
ncbi:hypothetical protein FACS1894123_04120 [Bacteroidia bacterium]|nr:hypothetical protein FACS1894123_04120 [Bacteroidia bacterium]